ncbi:MAG: hypothetical protein IPJ00_12180 [Saprospirales bacterium]|nr:hypothetical protein [Saprospirales bacterium]
MARPLLANVNLVKLFKQGINRPDNPCTHCNRCPVRTATSPLGCYDISRFASQEEMEAQIMEWSASSDERLAQEGSVYPGKTMASAPSSIDFPIK